MTVYHGCWNAWRLNVVAFGAGSVGQGDAEGIAMIAVLPSSTSSCAEMSPQIGFALGSWRNKL